MNILFFHDKRPLTLSRIHWEVNGWDLLTYGMLLIGAALIGIPLLLLSVGVHWNVSRSLPLGFYVDTHEPITRGTLVHFCLPWDIAQFGYARGYLGYGPCDTGTEELLKPVAAVAGDVVEIDPLGVSINGQPVANTPVFAADSRGYDYHPRLSPGTYIVPDGFVFVLSNYHLRSWDSRYYGFIDTTTILGTATPLWVWP